MLELIITLIVGVVAFFLGGIANQKKSVQGTILDTVNLTANEQIQRAIHSLFVHYAALIVTGTQEEARLNTQILSQKIDNFKSLQSKVDVLDKVLTNLETHE